MNKDEKLNETKPPAKAIKNASANFRFVALILGMLANCGWYIILSNHSTAGVYSAVPLQVEIEEVIIIVIIDIKNHHYTILYASIN